MRAQDSPKKAPIHLPPPKENYRNKSGVSKDNSPRSAPVFLFACMLSVQHKFNQTQKQIHHTGREVQRRKSTEYKRRMYKPTYAFSCYSALHDAVQLIKS